VIFLGTAGSIPTSKRSLPAIIIQRMGERILFDCGEGVQRQMIKAKISFHKKMKVFISHMHGDHVLGLPGLLQTMTLLKRERKLEVYGPNPIKSFIEGISETVNFMPSFPLEVNEINRPGRVCDENDYFMEAINANHSIESFSYALVEKPRPGKFYPEKAKALGIPIGSLWSKLQRGREVKLSDGRVIKPKNIVGPPRLGRKIVYTGDTRPFKGLEKFAENADLLIHEATFDDSLIDRAKEDAHSTPSQAAKNAKEARAKKLVLTHISSRYKDPTVLLGQAKIIFKNTDVAKDFLTISIPLF
jgi:ribonuclease Z